MCNFFYKQPNMAEIVVKLRIDKGFFSIPRFPGYKFQLSWIGVCDTCTLVGDFLVGLSSESLGVWWPPTAVRHRFRLFWMMCASVCVRARARFVWRYNSCCVVHRLEATTSRSSVISFKMTKNIFLSLGKVHSWYRHVWNTPERGGALTPNETLLKIANVNARL